LAFLASQFDGLADGWSPMAGRNWYHAPSII